MEEEDRTNALSDSAKVGYFKHTALNHSVPSIRLIRIHPDKSPEGRVQCELRHSTIDSTYTCLSYVWGDDVEPGHRITINGKYFRVRGNLWRFLRQARHKPRFEWLWIDALCIDQANNAERTHQVQQMGRIFSEAKEVISWLGSSMQIAEFLQEASQQESHDGEGLHDFGNSEYWDRAWITQEVALSARSTLMARHIELDMRMLPYIGSNYLSRVEDINPRNSRSLKGKSLIYLLFMFKFKECRIARDRVFSLLALCGEGSTLQVDYKIRDEQLAINVLRACRRSFCLCAIPVVCRALGIMDRPAKISPDVFTKLLPVEITVPVNPHNYPDCLGTQDSVYNGGPRPPSTCRCSMPPPARLKYPPALCTINFQDLCKFYGCSITLYTDPSNTSFSFHKMDTLADRFVTHTYDRNGSYSILFSRDIRFCTLRLSLGLLIQILQLASNQFIRDCCDRGFGLETEPASPPVRPVLQLCEPEEEIWAPPDEIWTPPGEEIQAPERDRAKSGGPATLSTRFREWKAEFRRRSGKG